MNFVQISKTLLFQGTSAEETKAMLKCLAARERHFQKSETIYRVGDTVTDVGLVLSGSVLIENDDFWGNRSILDQIDGGGSLGYFIFKCGEDSGGLHQCLLFSR